VLVAVVVLPPKGQPPGATRETRTLLWCFGQVSRSVPASCTDPRFGLLTALNKQQGGASIEPWRPLPPGVGQRRVLGDPSARVRGLVHQACDGYPHRSTSRSAGPAPVDGLRFDTVSDLLQGVTLRTGDDLMGDLDGGRSLRLTTYLETLGDLARLAAHLVKLRGLDLYRDGLDWLDHVVPVEDRSAVDDVLDELFDQVVGDEDLAVDLLLPSIPAAEDTDSTLLLLAFPGEPRAIRGRVTWPHLRKWMLGQTDQPGHAVLRKNSGSPLKAARDDPSPCR
jgi:hypothetical protein